MAYRLKTGRPIGAEVRRVADKQFALALADMRTVGDPKSDRATHVARRHIKKIRALIRLVQPSLGDVYRPANRRLRAVNRLLAPIADGEAVVDTLARIGRRHPRELPRPALASIRAGLVRRQAQVARQVRADGVLRAAARLVRAERKRIPLWHLNDEGFRAVAPGLERSVRSARRAMVLALEHPTVDHYHSWRRRVKDLWFQVRLLQARCGNGIASEERELEALDGCLGEYHNCALLCDVLATEPLVSRQTTARCLCAIRQYQTELRREAQVLAAAVHREKPRRFVKRVRRLWRSAKAASATTARTRAGWPQAA